MNIYQSNKLQDLENFDKYSAQLGIIERSMPAGAECILSKVNEITFQILW
jgi:hypothetical protein